MRFYITALVLVAVSLNSLPAYSASKKKLQVPSNSAVLSSSNSSYLSNNSLYVQGDSIKSYIDRLGSRTPVGGIVPTKKVPLLSIASSAKSLLRATPGALASSLVFMALAETAGWYFDQALDSWTIEKQFPIDDPLLALFQDNGSYYPSAQTACQASINRQGFTYSHHNMIQNGNSASCYGRLNDGRVVQLSSVGKTGNCPQGSLYTNGYCSITEQRPVTTPDIDQLDITSDSAQFYQDLLRDSCAASSNPVSCYDSLVEESSLSGPSTVKGPSTTSTTHQANSDGSTSTVTTKTNTDYDLEYQQDGFTYVPKTTTTTEVDGVPTSTTVTEDGTEVTSEEKPEEETKPSEISGMSCGATVLCSGDAIQCAVASSQKETTCTLKEIAQIDTTDLKTQVSSDLSGSDYQPFGESETSVTDLSSYIDTSSEIASSCPVLPVLIFTINGQTGSFDFSQWLAVFCQYAGWFGTLLVIFAMRGGMEIIARGFG